MMETQPLVTIMMPVYNGYRLIKASVKSLLAQTYTNWECIIVDDGSTDGTSDYVDSISDNRFVIYHFSNNQGRPCARQKALEMARGKYLAMLDAEDLYSPQKLARQVSLMESHPDIILVSSAICSFGTKTQIRRRRGSMNKQIVTFNGHNVPLHASSMLITDRAKNIKYNPFLNFGEDADFLMHYLLGGKYLLDPQIMYYYSEFDSVTKRKILKSYMSECYCGFMEYDAKRIIENGAKFALQSLRFPFLSIEKIVASRGRILSNSEEDAFQKECQIYLP